MVTLPRRPKYETQLKRNKEAVPTEPQEEITRVFKTHTAPDGADVLEEQPPITNAPVPGDETLEADLSSDDK